MKRSRQVLGVLLFGGIMTGAFFVPEISGIKNVGNYLLEDSCPFSYEWNEGEGVVEHLLGGQTYWKTLNNEKELQELLVKSENDENWTADDIEKKEHPSVQTMATAVPKPVVIKDSAKQVEQLKKSNSAEYLLKNFYIVDSTTSVSNKLFPVKTLLTENFSLSKQKNKKQILIYHTHGASEYFIDSSKKDSDSVVGVGDALTKELEKRGYGVIHDRTKYDMINGQMDRSRAYNEAYSSVSNILQNNPSIEVVIDLHRDSVGKGKHTYTMNHGKKCALVMFFNGMSRNRKGPIEYLHNDNLTSNLAFSLQLKCMAMNIYPGLTKPIYLKGYRYNLHMKKRSLLIELGNENNTVEEAKNATEPLADVIDRVLSGKRV